MGNSSSNSLRVNESIRNNFLSVNDNTCSVLASSTISGNDLNLSNINGGKLEFFTFTGAINATCRITQQVSQSIADILTSQADMAATNTSDWFNGGSIYSSEQNKATIEQSILNNVVSVSVSNCNSVASSDITDNTATLQYSNNANVKAYTVNTDMNATCTLNNVVSQQASSKIASKVAQTAANVGMMVAIFTALFACVAICVVGAVIIFGGGFFVYEAHKHSSSKPSVSQDVGGGYQGGGQGGGYQDISLTPEEIEEYGSLESEGV